MEKYIKTDKFIYFDDKLTFKDEIGLKSAYFEEKRLFNIDGEFRFSFSTNFEIVTPHIEEDYYEFNYAQLSLNKNNFVEFNVVIVKVFDFILFFEIYFDSGIKILKKENALFVSTKDLKNFKIVIKISDARKSDFNFDKKITKYEISNKVGLFFDCKYYNDKINFSGLKENLDFNYIILKNWDKIRDIESFLNILKINDIKYIFEYNFELLSDESENMIKYRDNSPYYYDGKKYADYFSEEGKEKVYKTLCEFEKKSCEGIYIEDIVFKCEESDCLEKIAVKDEKKISPYVKNIKKGLKESNLIFDKIENKSIKFYSKIINKETKKLIFFYEIGNNLAENYRFIEDYFNQGYGAFSLFIKEKKKSSLFYLPAIFSESLFIDINLFLKISANKRILKRIQNIIDLKRDIKTYLENISRFVFNPFYLNEKLSGFTIGDTLYFTFVKKLFLLKYFFLPEGEYFSLEEKKVIKGGVFYYFNDNSNEYLVFQKSDSILPILRDNSLFFYIFLRNNYNTVVNRYDGKYNFEARFEEKNVLIVFSSDFKNTEKINLLLVIDNKEIDYVELNGEKIYFEKSLNYSEMSFLNKTDKNQIKITFS
ncbi:MAG TPA: hypothetical protein PLO89_03700 [Spirochaetota bacterium]|nr:hypothetical protein [Spirochaetota bacterium]